LPWNAPDLDFGVWYTPAIGFALPAGFHFQWIQFVTTTHPTAAGVGAAGTAVGAPYIDPYDYDWNIAGGVSNNAPNDLSDGTPFYWMEGAEIAANLAGVAGMPAGVAIRFTDHPWRYLSQAQVAAPVQWEAHLYLVAYNPGPPAQVIIDNTRGITWGFTILRVRGGIQPPAGPQKNRGGAGGDKFDGGWGTPINGTLHPCAIDVYTDKGGLGPGGTYPFGWADAYRPQERVCVFAKVTYNGEPVEYKPVAFEMIDPNGTSIDFRSAFTDASGVANTSFRIPSNPVFGDWTVVGTVDVTGTIVNDTVTFKVGWIVEILNVDTVDAYGNPKTSFTKGEHMYFNVTVQNIAFTSKKATLTIVIYDECGVPIGQVTLQNWVIGPGRTEIFIIDLQIPNWAYVGVTTVYSNAYTDLPTQGGTPTCPEKSTTFLITKT
jgi:hypothetical protein